MLTSLIVLALQQALVVQDVTVIDVAAGAARAHMTVTVRDGRIATIAPAAGAPIERGARVIDGTGRFLVPGFVDTHAHVAFGPVSFDTANGKRELRMPYDHAASREMLTTLLAFGVLTVRNPGGPTREAVAIRDSVASGAIPGPRIRTAGAVIDALPAPGLSVGVTSPDSMRAEVARQAAMGVDYVKLYAGLAPPVLLAGVDEARRRGVKSVAHPLFTSWTEAATAGIDALVHVIPGSPRLLPAEKRPEYMKSFAGTQFMATWFRYADLASPEIREMTEALVRHRTSLDLTLVTFDAMFRGNLPAITRNPDLLYGPLVLQKNWREFQLTLGWTEADFLDAASLWPNVERFTKHLFDAGVSMTIGTDTPNPWVAPGASLHQELELHVKAGIPVARVLRMATLDGARSLGFDDAGSIEVGKRADFVVLTANPLDEIRNTRAIEYVVQGGKVHTPRALLPSHVRAQRPAPVRPGA
jgi:hypothetical protein